MATNDKSDSISRVCHNRKHDRIAIQSQYEHNDVNNNNNKLSSPPDELVAQSQWKPFHGRWQQHQQQQSKQIKSSNNTHISQQKKNTQGKEIKNSDDTQLPAPPRSRWMMTTQSKAEQDAQRQAHMLKKPAKVIAVGDATTHLSRHSGHSVIAPTPGIINSSHGYPSSLRGLPSLQGAWSPLQFPPQLTGQPGLSSWNGNLQQLSAMSTHAKPSSIERQKESTDASSRNTEAEHRKTGTPYVAPVPTAKYMAQANKPPITLNFMQPLLIILDLNGTLLYRTSKKMPPKFVRRPALNHFLERLTSRHMVMVWSSAQPATVEAICRQIFSPVQYSKLVAIWNRTHLGLPDDLYRNKVQVYKQLEKVWADKRIQQSYPDKKHRCGKAIHHVLKYHPHVDEDNEMTGVMNLCWDQSNTVLIDDSRLKAAANPYNIFEVPEFKNTPDVADDLVLKALLERIKILAKSNDVSRRLHSWSKEGGEGIKIDRDHILQVAESEYAEGPIVDRKNKQQLKAHTESLIRADEKTDDKIRRLIRKEKKMESSRLLKKVRHPAPLIVKPEEEKRNNGTEAKKSDETSAVSEGEISEASTDSKNPEKDNNSNQNEIASQPSSAPPPSSPSVAASDASSIESELSEIELSDEAESGYAAELRKSRQKKLNYSAKGIKSKKAKKT